MTIHITLTLDAEQQDALTDMLGAYNASVPDPLTEEEYLTTVLTGAIGGQVKARYDIALRELGEAASQLDYPSRQALIAQVRGSIPS